jgi:hypothetical protein
MTIRPRDYVFDTRARQEKFQPGVKVLGTIEPFWNFAWAFSSVVGCPKRLIADATTICFLKVAILREIVERVLCEAFQAADSPLDTQFEFQGMSCSANIRWKVIQNGVQLEKLLIGRCGICSLRNKIAKLHRHGDQEFADLEHQVSCIPA